MVIITYNSHSTESGRIFLKKKAVIVHLYFASESDAVQILILYPF